MSVESPKAIETRRATVADDARHAAPRDRDVVGAGDAVDAATRSRRTDGFNRIASPRRTARKPAAAARIAQVGRKIQRLFDTATKA